MIIVDQALLKLEKQNKQIRVGMVGAGFMAKGLLDQIINQTPGMHVVAVSTRTFKNAKSNYQFAGVKKTIEVNNLKELDSAIKSKTPAITKDFALLCL